MKKLSVIAASALLLGLVASGCAEEEVLTEVPLDETVEEYTPSGEGNAEAPLDPSIIIGMSEGQASTFLTAEGIDYRIVERDGESFPVTMDYSPERANLTIQNSVVTEVQFG